MIIQTAKVELRVEKNNRANLKLRTDHFFEAEESGYSAADAVCEAVIRAAQKERQEKKIRFQGNLLGNIPFHPEVDQSQANLLIRLASELSYQQYCLLSIFMHPDTIDLSFTHQTKHPWMGTNYSDTPEQIQKSECLRALQEAERETWLAEMTGLHHTIRQEAYDLYARALVRTEGESGEGKLMLVNHFMYDKVYVVNIGRILYELLHLDDMDVKELESIVNIMRSHVPYS